MYSFKKFRTRTGLSQKKVGEALGITGQAYSNYETGRREADYHTLKRMAALFGASIDDLLAEPDAPALSGAPGAHTRRGGNRRAAGQRITAAAGRKSGL